MVDEFNLADMMSNSRKRTFTREHRMKISLAKRGKPHSTEHCENISKALTGKTFSEDHKDRIRKALQGNRNALKNEIFLSDELISLYGHDEECIKWILENKDLLNQSEYVKTDYQLFQDTLKENILYDDAIQPNNDDPPPTIIDILIRNESPIKIGQDIRLSNII